MEQTFITLNDGNKIPQFGLGVYQVPEGEETIKAVVQEFFEKNLSVYIIQFLYWNYMRMFTVLFLCSKLFL